VTSYNFDTNYFAEITGGKKIVSSYYDKMGYSIALDDLSCHLNTISECNPTGEGLVIEGYTGYTQKKK
jgi:hypothetical protein